MKEKVLQTIREYSLVQPGQKIVVAVSGGPDSMALLYLLHELSSQLDVRLHVVHVNHQLRPQAAAEAVLVKKHAARLGLPVTVCKINVTAIQARLKLSLEAAARHGRYRALQHVVRRVGAHCIATGHHQDDCIETLLLRLLAGSGLDGLKGIPVRRALSSGIEIIRPLYRVSRREIEYYCRQKGLQTAQDLTNLQPIYLRNRIRLQLLPFLEQEFGPSIRRTMARTAEILAADSALLTELTEQAYASVLLESTGKRVCLSLPKLREQPPAMQGRLIRRALWAAGAQRVEYNHVKEVLLVAQSSLPSAWTPVVDRIIARREYDKLYIERDSRQTGQTEMRKVLLQLPGKTYLPWCEQWMEAKIIPNKLAQDFTSSPMEAYLAADEIKGPVIVRTRQAGDRVRLFRRPGKRKLKDIFIDKKIPLRKRDQIPIVVNKGQILWVAGVDIADEYRVTPKTKQVLHLRLFAENSSIKKLKLKDGAKCRIK